MPRKKSVKSTNKRLSSPKARKVGVPKKRAPRSLLKAAFVVGATDPAQDNLKKIDHIVILMMENRSFDHTLGYLKLLNGRTDVDGLTAGMSNSFNNQNYPIHLLAKTAFGKNQDPCHDGNCVTQQLSNNNGGFVSSYAGTHPNDPEVDLVMGYYDGATLKVYDHLARNFLICDRWFCSVNGATWPNRLYAVTGKSDGSKNNKQLPFYDLPSFVRYLPKNVSWRWYAHDVATLRLIDSQFRPPLHPNFPHFSFFDRRSLLGGNSFLEDAAAGKLASVSWIDPNFYDLHFIDTSTSNDDHPPGDIKAGQELVLKLYNAVVNSPKWNKTLLVIVYDEHGGFFDHVPTQPAQDDNPNFRTYGVRVPAFIVSPWVERTAVSHTVFDHTSIIKSILLRFCQRADGSIPDMGARVTNANHLGGLLTLGAPRPPTPFAAFSHLVADIANWRASMFTSRMELMATGIAPEPHKPNELQQGVIKAKKRLRERGLPEGQP